MGKECTVIGIQEIANYGWNNYHDVHLKPTQGEYASMCSRLNWDMPRSVPGGYTQHHREEMLKSKGATRESVTCPFMEGTYDVNEFVWTAKYQPKTLHVNGIKSLLVKSINTVEVAMLLATLLQNLSGCEDNVRGPLPPRKPHWLSGMMSRVVDVMPARARTLPAIDRIDCTGQERLSLLSLLLLAVVQQLTTTNSNNSFGFCLTGVFSQSLQARPGPRRTSKEEPFRFAGA